MPRLQALVTRGDRILMVRHRQHGVTWWCLPGGAPVSGETPAEGALRELREECNVDGRVLRQVARQDYGDDNASITFLIDIGAQEPTLGHDPEVDPSNPFLVQVAWMSLRQIPARDRTYLWAAGLHGVPAFLSEIQAWGSQTCYPRDRT